MKTQRLLAAMLFVGFFVGCEKSQPPAPQVTVTINVSGATMADLPAIKAEVAATPGVADVQAGQLSGEQATLPCKDSRKGAELAEAVTKGNGVLKNIQGVNGTSVQHAHAASPAAGPATG